MSAYVEELGDTKIGRVELCSGRGKPSRSRREYQAQCDWCGDDARVVGEVDGRNIVTVDDCRGVDAGV